LGSLSTRLGTSTAEIGKIIRLTVKGSIRVKKEAPMRESGKMITSMEMALRHGKTALVSKEATITGSNRASGPILGPINRITKASGIKIISRESGGKSGQMAAPTQVLLKTISCTASETTIFQTVNFMKAFTRRIRSTDGAPTLGQMARSTWDGGLMGNKTG
jgi:hypothetical protein